MKIVLQRVKQAAVEVNKQTVGQISKGVCLLIGVEKGDTEEETLYLAHKITELRIFPDEEGKMNLSLLDILGEVLAVSQFTLAASLKKGRRPSFDNAEDPERAERLFRFFVDMIKEKGIKVETGVFGALMDVRLVNDGPVTFILEKKKLP
ncbi:MAG: D-aminoacyl-tRNA deacylase [Candidatus Aminicenantes bacterium]|nr:D-aminoacyl-tRNA deacylase [Candidatus Aminicenantes bacterium]MDH5704549.1 D-aminoacyl-tRNA deacylase [Candidatus Aminicenantes bacterium]